MNNLVLIFYPQGASGRFIISSLCFSDSWEYPFGQNNEHLLQLTQEEKYQRISDRLNENNKQWNDFGIDEPDHLLSVRKFNFNLALDEYLSDNLDQVNQQTLKCYWESEINVNGYVFKTVDTLAKLYINIKRYPHAKIVYFTNNLKYLNTHRKQYTAKYTSRQDNIFRLYRHLYRHWDTIKGSNWPDMPCSKQQYNSLPVNIQNELVQFEDQKKFLNFSILYDFYKSISNNKDVFFWNINHIGNKKQYLNSLQKLYKQFNFTNYNKSLLSNFYDNYFRVLSGITPNTEPSTIEELLWLKKVNDPKSMKKRLGKL